MHELVLEQRPDDGVLLLSLNRPDKRNALSNPLLAALAERLRAATEDDAVRCVVLTGNERVFSAGADISEMNGRGIEAIDNPARQDSWHAIESFPKPYLAAIEGYAFGGGHELAMLTDIVIAARDARVGQPEINLGILPGDGGTQRLTYAVGKGMAMRMMLTGEPIDAEAAHRLGLIAEITEPGEALTRALEIARVIASKNPIGARLVKQCVLTAHETGLGEGLRAERQAVRLAFARGAHVEGMRAFLDRRK